MNPSRRRAIAIAVAMCATSALGNWARPTRHVADEWPKIELERIFPQSFGDWRVDDSMPIVLPSPDTQAVLNKVYSQTLSRTYVDRSGTRIMLSVAYGGDQSDATRAHRPEVCYPAQGFQIDSDASGHLKLLGNDLKVRRLVAHSGPRVEPITYWVMVGNVAVISGTEQKLAQMRFGARGLVPDGMLVRVSSIDNDSASAFNGQDRFLTDLATAIDRQWSPRIFGVPIGT